jgi:hypothetical protein
MGCIDPVCRPDVGCTMTQVIRIDSVNFASLRAALKKAQEEGATQFTFEGHELVTAYAVYLVQAIEMRILTGQEYTPKD